MTVEIFGHRGYPARFPENSLEGIAYAINHGVDGIETDVQLSADGQLIVMHDERVDRTTGAKGWVADFTRAQLDQMTLANGERIPSLEEVLALIAPASVQLNIEFKTSKIRYPGIEARTQAAVAALHLDERVIYSSFNPDSIRTIHMIAPHMKTALLTEWAFTLQGVPTYVDAVHVAHYEPRLHKAQRLWTVNDPIQMRQLLVTPDVTALITDQFEEALAMRDMVGHQHEGLGSSSVRSTERKYAH